MGAALGGGAATSAFGGRGAVTFLSRVTGICAMLFFVTSLGLSFVGMKTSVVGPVDATTTQGPQQAGSAAATDAGTEAAAPAATEPADPKEEEKPPEGAAPAQPEGSTEPVKPTP